MICRCQDSGSAASRGSLLTEGRQDRPVAVPTARASPLEHDLPIFVVSARESPAPPAQEGRVFSDDGRRGAASDAVFGEFGFHVFPSLRREVMPLEPMCPHSNASDSGPARNVVDESTCGSSARVWPFSRSPRTFAEATLRHRPPRIPIGRLSLSRRANSSWFGPRLGTQSPAPCVGSNAQRTAARGKRWAARHP